MVHFLAFVSESRRPRDDAQIGQAREVVDQALGDAVREIFSLRVGAERQDGQRLGVRRRLEARVIPDAGESPRQDRNDSGHRNERGTAGFVGAGRDTQDARDRALRELEAARRLNEQLRAEQMQRDLNVRNELAAKTDEGTLVKILGSSIKTNSQFRNILITATEAGFTGAY
jgi:hypothetical protein